MDTLDFDRLSGLRYEIIVLTERASRAATDCGRYYLHFGLARSLSMRGGHFERLSTRMSRDSRPRDRARKSLSSCLNARSFVMRAAAIKPAGVPQRATFTGKA
jgi:hypothetical protein